MTKIKVNFIGQDRIPVVKKSVKLGQPGQNSIGQEISEVRSVSFVCFD